jgi:beta-phosphoglucomutase-like phosphatase (HAD superfamily)
MAAPPLPAAVLFDMDGTLVDTEAAWVDGQYAVAAGHGVRWAPADEEWVRGRPLPDYAAEIIARGADAPAERILVDLVDHVAALLRQGVTWRPGARRLLSELAACDVPCGLVTMAFRPIAELVVSAAPAGTLVLAVAGDDVQRGKPHPEPYLRGAAAFGRRPERCVAVEDTDIGATSAEAAGIPTLAVPNLGTVPAKPGRSRIASLDHVTVATLARIGAGEVVDDLAIG